MSSRDSLTEGDRQALAEVTRMMALSAEAASKASTEAASKLEQAIAADVENLQALQADCDKLSKDLQVWEALCNQLVSRYAQNEAELETATMACAACDAVAQVALDAYQATKSKVDGPLKVVVAANSAKLQAAKQVVADLERSGDDELEWARYPEEAEMVCLEQAATAEANLEKLLDKARTLLAVALEDENADACTNGKAQLSSAKAEHSARQQAATQAQEASRFAADAVAAAQAELQSAESIQEAQKDSCDEKDEDVSPVNRSQQIDALRSRLTDLKKALSEKQAEEQTAKTEADEAKTALEAVERQERADDAKVQPTMNLLESERAMLEQCINARETKEVSLMGDASKLAAEWENRKTALEEELLRAQLQMKTVNKEVFTFERVTNTHN